MHSFRNALLLSTALATAGLPVVAQAQQDPFLQSSTAPTGPGIGTLAIGALVLGAAAAMIGGGGGNGGDGGGNDDAPDGPDNTDPTPDAGGPRDAFNTDEYRRNWGLEHINVDARYSDGGTGIGALGSVFDTGANTNHEDISGQVRFTHSYYNDTGDVSDANGHGTFVLGIMGAKKNDIGSHGVAFDSEFAIFQGLEGTGNRQMGIFRSWADATTQSVHLGAEVINHSWTFVDDNGQSRTIAEIENRNQMAGYIGADVIRSLDLATRNDLVSVFAAGNSGLDNVGINAGIPVFMPEYQDHILAVVALDSSDRIASYSNRCGLAADFCIAAPGSGIFSTTVSGGYGAGSGTSDAAPHVSGSVLVMASNFPELTAPEITTILRETARDLGAPGVDAVYGVGALDLENAIAPQGAISLQTSGTLGQRTYTVSESHISTSGGLDVALRTALAPQSIVVTDGYDRAYTTQMDNFVGSGADISRDEALLEDFALGTDGYMNIGNARNSLAIARSGLGGLGNGDKYPSPINAPYALLVEDASSMSYRTALGSGSVTFASAISHAEAGLSAEYVSATARAPIGAHAVSVGLGRLSESGSFLGTDLSGAFGNDVTSSTNFLTLSGEISLSGKSSLVLGGSFGATDFTGDGLLASGDDIRTSSLSAGISRTSTLRAKDRLSLSLSRDLSVVSGDMTIAVPVGIGAAENGVRSLDVDIKTANIEMDRTIAPIDLKIGYETNLFSGRLAVAAALRNGDLRHRVGMVGYSVRF